MINNRLKKISTLLLLCSGFVANSAISQTISSNLSFSMKSGNVFPVDANNCGVDAPTASFMAVEAYNSGSTEVNVGELKIDSVPTGWVILGPNGGKYQIGKLAAGQRKTAFFYIHANCADKGSTKGFRFTADNGLNTQRFRPAINCVGVVTTASAGSLKSKVSTLRVLGAHILDTVTFSFQGFNINEEMLFSPSTLVSFKSNLLRLEKVKVISAPSSIGVTAGDEDLLFFSPTFKASGSTLYDVSVLFKWKIVGLGDSTLLAPLSANRQGGPIKGKVGDSLSNLTSTPIILAKWINLSAVTNGISVTKTCNKSIYSVGDTLTYSISLTNSSAADVMVDRVVDTLPTGLTYIDIASSSDYTAADFSALPSNGATGNLLFDGGNTNPTSGAVSIFVPANSTKILKLRYKVATGTTGTLTNKAAAYVSSTRLDTGYAKVYQYGPPVATLKTKSNVNCKGGTDGSLEVQVTSGMPGFRYSIYGGSPFQYSPKFNNLPAASYVVTVTDSAGQTDTVQITVSEPTALNLAVASKTNVTCNGLNDGTVTLSCIGGTPGYSYKAGSGTYQSSTAFANVNVGTTIFTVIDNNFCIDTVHVKITEPSALGISLTSTNVTCNGGSDAKITVHVTGGTKLYQYKIGTGSFVNDSIFNSLSVGVYSISIVDANGCTNSKSVVITQPTALAVSATSTTNVDCKGNSTGSITVGGSGGTTPYTYNYAGGSYASVNTFGSLAAGNHTIGIKDANGCNSSVSVTITEPNALSVSASSTTNVDCKGNSTGSITVGGSGGTTPYTYNYAGGSYASANTFSSLAAGTHTIGIKDANGCTSSVSVTITEPAALNLSATITKPVCYDDKTGTITLSATGGTTAYSYRVDSSWSMPTSAYVSTAAFGNYYEGKYAAQVKDANGCLDTVQISIQHQDLIKPVPVPHKILTVYLGATGTVFVSANMADSASTDNCAIASRSITQTSFNCSNVGYNTVNFKVVDINGNRDSINFIVNVLDTSKPSLNTRGFTVYLDNSGLATLSIDSVDLGTTDQCGPLTRSLSKTSFDCQNTGFNNTVNKVVFTATDANGNVSIDTLTIIVLDTTKPTLVLKNVSLYLDASGKASLTTSDFDNGSYDNCNIDSLIMSDTTFDCSQTGVNVITITGVDPSQNRSSATINVTVYDTIKPTLQVKNHTVYLDTTGNGSMTKMSVIALLYDNCGIDTLDVSRLNWTVSDTGVNEVYVWAEDASGNKIGPDTALVTVIAKDTDGDGIPDYVEGSKDTDGDGVFDFADMDSDNDGLLDFIENENQVTALDLDGDGIPNYKDLDSDNDGIYDIYEVDGSDPDADGVAGTSPVAVNSAGIPIIANGGMGYNEIDTDSDGKPDYKDLDTDADGIADQTEGIADPDSDGVGNWRDTDSDGDGIIDATEGTVDTDSDGISDFLDTDSDNDGISDQVEGTVDSDGDGTGDWRDLDSDNDGISDQTEGTLDTDSDGTVDRLDLDSDNDGIPDKVEGSVDSDGDGRGDWRDLDSDDDGIQDSFEAGSNPATPVDTDGDGKPDYLDTDSDADGISDTIEDVVDTDGDGISDFRDGDSDGDGISDLIEGTTDTDGDGTGDWRDLDSDNDGINDKTEGSADSDGDGTGDWRDLDSDNDNISDKTEGTVDTDGDGKSDYLDTDSDGDGISDNIEGTTDTDGDGTGDWRDLDSDNDGISDQTEGTTDTDSDGTGDWPDLDSDNDGINDQTEGTTDTDGDGTGDWRDIDSDGDNILDATEGTTDTDGDGTGDWRDLDSDNDGISDSTEGTNDFDGDGIGNWRDLDSDADGINDQTEGTADKDGDLQGNWLDLDSDGDGISDKVEGTTDTDGDGVADYLDLDSDGDGISDTIEGTTDTDGDGTGDWRDLDSDNDGINDQTEGTTDTDGDGVGNWRDADSDGDGIDDKTEGTTDTDNDGQADYLDLDSDNDGIDDKTEGTTDTDGDGKGNWRDTDSDDDEILDGDLQEGTGDSDGDGIPNYIDPDFFIPEGISPNGDNVNDVLYIRGLKAKVFSQATLLVFNRWGQVVYESNGTYKNDWNGVGKNGDALPEGVYYIVFKYGSTTVDRNIYIKN
jgi:gliding motility-associated-like protein/uncharacterized repeat protein (TIGR01451 family)